MKLQFLGATGTVTGSKYLLEAGGKRVLVDCGLFQSFKQLRLRNWTRLPVAVKSIDAVVLTHAHVDHSGYLPHLVKNGFHGKVWCTRSTADLCAILLQEEEARYANRHGYSRHKPCRCSPPTMHARRWSGCIRWTSITNSASAGWCCGSSRRAISSARHRR